MISDIAAIIYIMEKLQLVPKLISIWRTLILGVLSLQKNKKNLLFLANNLRLKKKVQKSKQTPRVYTDFIAKNEFEFQFDFKGVTEKEANCQATFIPQMDLFSQLSHVSEQLIILEFNQRCT